jgi:hypothetical protein
MVRADMAAEYSEEIKEAAKVLHIEGAKSAEIRARLMEGTAGLPYPAAPSERTVDKWRRGWDREGIRTGFQVRAGDEEATENAIYRRHLGLHRAMLTRAEDNLAAGKTDNALLQGIRTMQSVIDSARAKRRIAAKQDRGERLGKDEAAELGSSSTAGASGSMLARLAAEQNAADPADRADRTPENQESREG